MPRLSLDNPGIVAALSLGAGALRGAKQERDTQKAFRRATAQDSYRAGLERQNDAYETTLRQSAPDYKMGLEKDQADINLTNEKIKDVGRRYEGDMANNAKTIESLEQRTKALQEETRLAKKAAAEAEKRRSEDEKEQARQEEVLQSVMDLYQAVIARKRNPRALRELVFDPKNNFLKQTANWAAISKIAHDYENFKDVWQPGDLDLGEYTYPGGAQAGPGQESSSMGGVQPSFSMGGTAGIDMQQLQGLKRAGEEDLFQQAIQNVVSRAARTP